MVSVHQIERHSFFGLLDSSSVVVDLGMNHGAFAEAVVQEFGCRVFGLEPEPRLFSALPATPGVVKEQAAVAPVNGVILLHLNASQCASTQFIASAEAVEVPSTTLVSFLDRHHLDTVDLVKMDIEGAEFGVLESTADSDLLRIRQLSVEFHDFLDSKLRPQVKSADARLRRLGFQRFKFSVTTFGDVLYLHPAVHLPRAQQAFLLLRFKFLSGLRRRLSRVGPARVQPQG